MTRRKKTLLDGILYFINILAAAGLLFSYLAYYFDPTLLTFFAFFGLAYPVLLLLNLIFIVYWILRFKLKMVLSVLCIGLGYMHMLRFYQFSGNHKVVNPGTTLKVMTYNVRLFNQYNWLNNEDVPGSIAEMVNREDPDILFIQEYAQISGSPDFGYPYRHQVFNRENKANGLVIFSKIPFENTGQIRYGPGPDNKDAGRAIYADLNFEGKNLRLINIHLASVGFKKEDYQRLESPNSGKKDEIKRDFLKIYHQLKRAFKKRSHQVKILEQAVEDSPHATVVAGDFNDTPQSYTYHRIDLLLEDSYRDAGEGLVRTYAKGPVPMRIDHVFHSAEINAINYRVLEKEYSDHFPVITELEWMD